jgi:hypothetical protein
LHVADFITCVKGWEVTHGTTGLIAASNPNQPVSALVRVTGTFLFTRSGFGSRCWSQNSGTMSAVKPNGTSIVTDADLTATDQVLFGPLRGSGKLAGPVKVSVGYGASPINDEAWSVDANTGINIQISNPAAVPIGTVIVVVWYDGTTAQFIRSNSVPSLLWVYVPGSMKDKSGNPITPLSGLLILNPHSAGSGSGIVPIASGANSSLQSIGGNYCSGSATLTIPDDETYVFIFYYPC